MRERLLPVLTLGCLAAAGPALLIAVVGDHTVNLEPSIHFYAVGVTALAAAGAAVALTIVGARFNDTRTVLVGTAFAAMAALLALHGLATPGFFFEYSGVLALTGGTTLPVGAAILAVSVVPLPRPLRGVNPLLVLEVVMLVTVLGLGMLALFVPSIVPQVPTANSTEAKLLLAVGLALFAVLTLRAFRTFLLTRRISDLVVTVGLVWLATSLFAALTMTYVQAGWWLGHALELDGILVVSIPVALDLARSVQS